jgi:hypothetical protein
LNRSTALRKVFITATVICGSILNSGCKKGENDPQISFRTRKARLVGEWRLASGSSSYTGGNWSDKYTFTGTKLTLYSNYSGSPQVYTGSYILSLNILKDGTFNMKEVLAGTSLEISGTWAFNTGVGEHKAKDEVLFSIKEVSKGYTYGYHLFNAHNGTFAYRLKELRNKELVIYAGGKLFSDDYGNYMSFTNEYTFTE